MSLNDQSGLAGISFDNGDNLVPSDDELDKLGLPKIGQELIKKMNASLLCKPSGMLRVQFTEDVLSVRMIKSFITSSKEDVTPRIIEAYINFKIGDLRNQGTKRIYLFSHEHLNMNQIDWEEFKNELRSEL